jgi:dipeptidyl aminopeptidase/acylaminoacyl peptidase
LYRLSPRSELIRLTQVNEDRLRDIDMPKVKRLSSAGWMITPAGARDPVPTVVLIQDSPNAGPANAWSRHWNPMLFAAPGYAVVGMADSTDLPSAIDAENACIVGDGAHGGYWVYQVASEWSRQPRCLIANGGVADTSAMAYQTDEPWMHDWSARANPLHRAQAWRTPLLILHGERNFRVPYTQSVAAFTAARRHNVPSRLVVFPDEGVGVEAPKNAIQWYGEVFNWLDRWLSAGRDNANVAQ